MRRGSTDIVKEVSRVGGKRPTVGVVIEKRREERDGSDMKQGTGTGAIVS